jgi:putative FmdB family regulatory protein
MPIYEYHCESCGEDFEYIVFGSDQPDCTSCNSSEVSKLMSACGFVSKGGNGESVKSSAADSSCGGCSAGSCAGCAH